MSESIGTKQAMGLDEEDIHDVLRNKRRRLVIDILKDSDGSVSVRDLSEQIGAIESESEPPPRNVKQSVYVSLIQTHLPKLDDLGIINYESDGKMVSVDGSLNDVTLYLETVPKYGISRSEYYLALTLLALLTVLGAAMSVPLITILSPLEWAYLFFLAILISSAYHTYSQGSTIVSRLLRRE